MASSKLTIAEVKAATGISSGVGNMSQAERAAAVAAATPPAPTTVSQAKNIASAVAKADVIVSTPTATAADIKDAGKAAASSVTTAYNELKNTQQLEVNALRQESGSSAATAEKAQNKVELSTFLSGLLANPNQSTLTQASTYSPDSAAYARVNDAYDLAQKYNLAPGKVSGDVTTGIPLHRVDTYLQSDGEKGGLVKKVIDFRGLLDEAVKDGVLTNQDIVTAAREADVKKSEEKLMKQLETKGFIKFGDTSGDNVNYATTTFTQDPTTGAYVPTGTDKYRYDAPSESGLGPIAGLVASIASGGLLAPALGITSAMGVGALSGGIGGLVSGGDLKSALSGAALGGIGGLAKDFISSTGAFQPSGWDFGPGNMTAEQLANLNGTAALPLDQVKALTSGYTPSYNLNFGTPTGAGGLGLGTGVTELGTNTGISGLGTEAANSMFSAQDLVSAFPGAFPSVTDAANWMVGQGLAGSVTQALGGATAATAALSGAAGGGGAGGLLGQAANALGVTPNTLTGLVGTGANLLGGYLNTQASLDAAQAQAKAQIEAAKIAADAAKFRPVGVTTRFGSSNFEFDPTTGYLKSAGYTLSPDVKAQQDQLMATSGGLLNQFTGAQATTAPMGTAAQRMMELGQGYLATTPQEQAAKYLAEQQALLATGRERELAALQNKLQQQGRLGLATGGTSTGMMAANPELEAFYNAKRQQDLQLAAQATQGGMDYAKFGAGMVGSGGTMLRDMYSTQSAAYQPYQTAMGGAQYLEGLGQNAMDIGVNLGKTSTTANAAAGQLLGTGMMNAANTQGQADQQAGSTWGNLLQGGAQALQNWTQPTQQQAFKYDPYTGKLLGA